MAKDFKDTERVLNPIAQTIAEETAQKINQAAFDAPDTPEMPYRAQYILEQTIKCLQDKV